MAPVACEKALSGVCDHGRLGSRHACRRQDLAFGFERIGTSDDALLARLITDVSGAITAYLGRPSLTPRSYMERLDGNDKTRLFLRHYPVLQMISLLVESAIIPAAVRRKRHRRAAICSSHGMDCRRAGRRHSMCFASIIARAGRTSWPIIPLVMRSRAKPPACSATGLYNVSAEAPFGPWASDAGVTYANGNSLIVVATNPAAGEYAVSGGVYSFAAADAGASLLISYGFIPAAINNACIEWVAERYRYRTRVGQSSQTVSGQMTSAYSLKDMPDFIRASLDPYRNVTV